MQNAGSEAVGLLGALASYTPELSRRELDSSGDPAEEGEEAAVPAPVPAPVVRSHPAFLSRAA